MFRGAAYWFGLGLLGIFACGGSTPQPAEPTGPSYDEVEQKDIPPPAREQSSADTESGEAPKDAAGATKPKDTGTATPEFTEGMSVDEAIKLVPRDAQRMNLDSDALGAPLVNGALYEPCKLGHNQHFKLRVAIWNGKAVGLDVTTQPNNPKAQECIAAQIRGITWKDKVPSLNTVEYAM